MDKYDYHNQLAELEREIEHCHKLLEEKDDKIFIWKNNYKVMLEEAIMKQKIIKEVILFIEQLHNENTTLPLNLERTIDKIKCAIKAHGFQGLLPK